MDELPVIYIVDDDIMIRKLLKSIILSAFQVRVVDFDNGEAALRKAAENPPALIILDLYMPNLSGKEALRMMRSMQETTNIPIIICSTESQMEAIKDIVQFRIEGYLLKPFEAASVVQKIMSATGIEPANPLENKEKPSSQQNGETAFSVMLIERDPHINTLISSTLESQFSAQIMEVPTLEEAPHILEKFTPALIVAGLEGSDNDLQHLARMFEIVDRQFTSVAVCAGAVSQESAAELVALGVAVIVLKPFTAEQFTSKIRRIAVRKTANTKP